MTTLLPPGTTADAAMLQVRQPIYSSSVGKWKRYEKHLAPLADLLQDEIAAYEAGK